MPFRFSQLLLTICGRGYSGNGLFVSTNCAQSVMIGAYFNCQARPLLGQKNIAPNRTAEYKVVPNDVKSREGQNDIDPIILSTPARFWVWPFHATEKKSW